MTGIKYFSTFSGIGGFELGIQAVMPDAECVGFSEIDKYAASVYQHHFTEAKNYGDITKINVGELPKFDLFVGGFPCQAFSVAGKRLGFDDTRGTLFFEVARILRAKRPRHLVLENVKGLLSHDSGKTFATILGVLTDLGYFVEWQVLNSQAFGVPHDRSRVYIVGHLGSAPRRQVFPHAPQFGDDAPKRGAIQLNKPRHSSYRIFSVNGSSPTLRARARADWHASPKIRTTQGDRNITLLECERLQGFPDQWTQFGVDGQAIPDTQRNKMCGNAVTVNVVSAVMERLFNDGH